MPLVFHLLVLGAGLEPARPQWPLDWKSLGRKFAESKTISFEKVPTNAVLWLRNLSHGIEEELFL